MGVNSICVRINLYQWVKLQSYLQIERTAVIRPLMKAVLQSQLRKSLEKDFSGSGKPSNILTFYISFAMSAQNRFQAVLSETTNLQNTLESWNIF